MIGRVVELSPAPCCLDPEKHQRKGYHSIPPCHGQARKLPDDIITHDQR